MTPLVLLIGFLGAGKTRLLRNLLPELAKRGLTPSVVINDYQNAKVDAETLRGLTEEIRAISGSCVCCGSKEELVEAMAGFQHRPGAILLVEANGTTDSEELIELLTLEPSLERFTLPVQVSVIDTKRWQKRFWHNDLELDQARTATHVFLSRQDEVDAKRIQKVRSGMHDKGVHAREVEFPALCDELQSLVSAVANTDTRHAAHHKAYGQTHVREEAHEHSHGDSGTHTHAAKHHFASFETALPERVDRAAFERFLENLPESVLRAKGVVRFAGEPENEGLHVFQKVGGRDGLYWAPLDADSTWRNPLLVCIGPDIPEESIRSAVHALSDPAPAVAE